MGGGEDGGPGHRPCTGGQTAPGAQLEPPAQRRLRRHGEALMPGDVTHHYRVQLHPKLHQLGVELTLALPEPKSSLLLTAPTWVSGAYAFMRYGRDLFAL